MKPRSKENRTTGRATMRVIAVVFLLLATVDLAFPQICGEDNEALFASQAVAATFGHADDSGEPLPHQPPAEDCFCCCSHIVAEDSASPLDQLAIASGSGRIVPPSVPLAPVRVLFHPPRLA